EGRAGAAAGRVPGRRRARSVGARARRGAGAGVASSGGRTGDRDPERVARGRGRLPMVVPTVLVIDDNPAIATAIDVLLSLHDIRTISARSPDEALARLGREPVDLVIQDMNFSTDTTSGDEGAALFRAIRARHPDLPVILLTAWTHLETAVELIKAGAADYLAKPWDNQRLVTAVRNLIELGQASRELAAV